MPRDWTPGETRIFPALSTSLRNGVFIKHIFINTCSLASKIIRTANDHVTLAKPRLFTNAIRRARRISKNAEPYHGKRSEHDSKPDIKVKRTKQETSLRPGHDATSSSSFKLCI
jgi:hypothetical protein